MTKKQFLQQITMVEEILNKLDMLEDRKWYPTYSESQASTFRHKIYLDIWQICIKEQYYDFQLSDNSFFYHSL
jgi:hypothetical protein